MQDYVGDRHEEEKTDAHWWDYAPPFFRLMCGCARIPATHFYPPFFDNSSSRHSYRAHLVILFSRIVMSSTAIERTSGYRTPTSESSMTIWESYIHGEYGYTELDSSDQLCDIYVHGTGLHLQGFNGMYLEHLSSTEWHLIYRYYARSSTTNDICLHQATHLFLRHRPTVHFVVQSRLTPEALLEITYYRLVQPDVSNPQHYLQRTNSHGIPMTPDGECQITAIFWTYPSSQPIGAELETNDADMEEVTDELHGLLLSTNPSTPRPEGTLVDNINSGTPPCRRPHTPAPPL
jgi:hypothetical protein